MYSTIYRGLSEFGELHLEEQGEERNIEISLQIIPIKPNTSSDDNSLFIFNAIGNNVISSNSEDSRSKFADCQNKLLLVGSAEVINKL